LQYADTDVAFAWFRNLMQGKCGARVFAFYGLLDGDIYPNY